MQWKDFLECLRDLLESFLAFSNGCLCISGPEEKVKDVLDYCSTKLMIETTTINETHVAIANEICRSVIDQNQPAELFKLALAEIYKKKKFDDMDDESSSSSGEED